MLFLFVLNFLYIFHFNKYIIYLLILLITNNSTNTTNVVGLTTAFVFSKLKNKIFYKKLFLIYYIQEIIIKKMIKLNNYCLFS